ncbi:MAG: acetoacetate--CoA ligase [Woeseiaceae bacterium]|nr:acetoacetate--CoA ligase [Woeseiaceae bacterium]
MDPPLYEPGQSQRAASLLASFLATVNEQEGLDLSTYEDLHRWSTTSIDRFWMHVWQFCEVIGEAGDPVLDHGDDMLSARFFPEARLNFAENLLRRRDDSDALVFWCEDRLESRMSWRDLHAGVSRTAQALREAGIAKGDRVAAFMPNVPETVVAMLATTSTGATWASCSPDFGETAVLDRFGQIEPTVLFACDGYFYAGKEIDVLPKLAGIAKKLPSVQTIVVAPFLREALGEAPSVGDVDKAVLFDDFVAGFEARDIDFERVPFRHPLYILFSSGTTGAPKCIVHSVGGTLLQHLKEHRLHTDVRPDDRVFYFTTCTWMMWNWLVSALASEATLLLYDGSPFHPNGEILFDFADAERMTQFGTSAKFIDALKKQGVKPVQTHDLSSVRLMASTGSPLVPESFDFVYQHIKSDMYLASIAGGTDIVSCFVLGNLLTPVRRGEIPGPGLGMAVEIWNDDGKPVVEQKGELVCTRPFPSMPVGFWGDDSGEKYKSAYFETFPGVWAHGDFAEMTRHGGFIIHGRSDATLNPGGVRIGTAEIYRQVEQIDPVLESIAIGQSWDDDVRVVLFVVLRDGESLTDELVGDIRTRIRQGASPRHVPAKIVQVADIPRTKSGKISELAVRDIVEGRDVKNKGALANPGALDLYRDLPELKS